MNLNYFKHLIKSQKIAILFFFVLYLGISYTPFLDGGSAVTSSDLLEVIFTIATVLSAMASFALPVLLFSFVHRKRSVDVYFSLPVSRKELLITTILFSFLLCFGFFFITSFIAYLLRGLAAIQFVDYLLVLCANAFIFLALLLINSFLYLLANNIFDGIVILAAYYFLPIMLLIMTSTYLGQMVAGSPYGEYPNYLSQYTSPLYLAAMVSYRTISYCMHHLHTTVTELNWTHVLFLGIYAALAGFGLYRHFVLRKTERAEQLSNNFFAYPFIINAYAFIVLMIFGFTIMSEKNGWGGFLIFYLILFFIYFVATFVYRRKIQIELKSLLLFLVGVCITLSFSFLSWKTRGFRMAYNYSLDKDKYLTYDYNAYVTASNLSIPYNYYNETPVDEVANVNFSITIPTDELEKHKDIIDLLEKHRHEAIDLFYTKSMYQGGAHFYVYNSNSPTFPFITSNQYTYHSFTPLTEADLKKIDEYYSVTVWNERYEDAIPLEKFLEERGAKG